MKRSLFILFYFCVISNTYASTNCLQRPSCDELGYTQTKKQCACFEKDILPCPFDINNENYAFCGDLNCKTKCKNFSTLYNGAVNTKAFVDFNGFLSQAPYAASLFYVGDKDGVFGQGTWYIPAIGELMDIYGTNIDKMTSGDGTSGAVGDTKQKINTALETLSQKGAHAKSLENTYYWSSSQVYNTSFWDLSMANGIRTYEWNTTKGDHNLRLVSSLESPSFSGVLPKIGDILYSDKSYGSANDHTSSKTPVGVIFAVSADRKNIKFINLQDLTFTSKTDTHNFNPQNPYGEAETTTIFSTQGFDKLELPVYPKAILHTELKAACGCSCEFDQCFQQNCKEYEDDCTCKTCNACYSTQDGKCIAGNCKDLCQDAQDLYNGKAMTTRSFEQLGTGAFVSFAASQFYIGNKSGDFGQGNWYIPAIGEWIDIYGIYKPSMTGINKNQGMIGNNQALINSALTILSEADSSLAAPFDLAENNSYWSSTERTYQGQWAFSILYGEAQNQWKHDLTSVRVGLIVENIPQLSESPKIGDVMYADKSYGSAADYNPSKTAAGIVFAVSEDGTKAKILNLRNLTFSSTNTDNNFDPENPYENTEPKTTWGKINPSASDFTSAQIVAALQKSCSCSCEFE